ncbi:coiled-coil domain-containing protein 137-like [Patiria miniata]|uniref:Uncharacterized protein n=1 Tax=Patiria miniata TaxID=46514 RepID=A0A914AMA0_PATMI|nr:coiled-coil domain-containing protein 137-like [Patiria miniata]
MPKSRHKKVKAVDPFCTGNRRALLLAKEKEFDRAPKHVSTQEIPRSLKNMLEATKLAKQGHTPKQKQKQAVQKLGSVERRPGESHNHFMKRVGSGARKKLTEVRSKLETDGMTGSERLKSDQAIKKNKERFAILQQKIKSRKFEKTLEKQEKDFFKDRVEFGEVVSAPPVFSAKPRKSNDKADKPGKRQLLLKSMLQPQESTPRNHNSGDESKKPNRTGGTSQDNAAKAKKRKHMSNAEKRNFDRSREAAILAYRKAKGHHGQDHPVLMST